MESLVNQSIGEYRVVEFLGAGGMGEVYRAIHTRLNRVVAIKVLSHTAGNAAQIERFYNEATVQASLRHPAVAEYYGFFELGGRPCILMEYVDGDTLHELLRRNGAFRCEEAMRIFLEIAGAMAHIHDQGVIHRDLKSSNIKINSRGQVKLLDFGIARGPRSARLTQTGAVIGTLENLAPEQVEGKAADARSDIWALGILLYEMLTEHLPFQACETAELYRLIRCARWPPPSKLGFEVSGGVERILARCLKKNPDRRFQSARDLKAAILTLQTGQAAETPGKVAPRRKQLTWVLAAALVLIGGLFLWRAAIRPPGDAVIVPVDAPGAQHPSTAETNGGVEVKTLTIDAVGGPAEVDGPSGSLGITPLTIRGKVGERLSFTLRREGFKDLPVELQVSERRAYEYTLEREH